MVVRLRGGSSSGSIMLRLRVAESGLSASCKVRRPGRGGATNALSRRGLAGRVRSGVVGGADGRVVAAWCPCAASGTRRKETSFAGFGLAGARAACRIQPSGRVCVWTEECTLSVQWRSAWAVACVASVWPGVAVVVVTWCWLAGRWATCGGGVHGPRSSAVRESSVSTRGVHAWCYRCSYRDRVQSASQPSYCVN